MSGDFGRHRLIYSVELLSPEFQELDNDHRVVWLYCKTSPQSTSVGIYRLSTALAVEDLRNLTAMEFDARLLAVCEAYDWRLDATTRVLWMPEWLEKNPPQSPNVVANWVKLLANVPDCDLKFEAITAMGVYLKGMKPSFLEPFERYRQRLSREFRQPKPQSLSKTLSNQRSGIRDPRSEKQGTGARCADGSERNGAETADRPTDERLVSIARETLKIVSPNLCQDDLVETFRHTARNRNIDSLQKVDILAALAVAQSERRTA